MAFRIVRSQRSMPIPGKISADTGGSLVAQAIAGLGGAITQEGIRADIKQADTELSEAQRKAVEENGRLSLSYRDNLNPDTFQPEYDKSLAIIKSFTPKNRRAARVYNLWLNDRIPIWQEGVDKSRYARIDDNFRTEGWNLRQAAIEDGDFMKYRLHLWKGRKLGVYSSEDAAQYLSYSLDARERFEKSEAVKIKAQAKEEYDAYVEATEQDWLVKLRKKELSENEVMSSNLEVDKKQEWIGYIDKQAEEVLKGEEVVTDEEVKGSLERYAYDIWTGAVSMEDFNKHLKVARYEDKTIDDAAYDELLSLAQREHKSYQAQAMSDAVTEAKGQLVEHTTESALERAIAAYERRASARELGEEAIQKGTQEIQTKRQKQLVNWGSYRRALRQLLQKNPDWNHDDIYIESQKLLATYRSHGVRPDGTKKDKGFLGELKLKGGGVATEYSVGVKLEANDGKETDIPSLVPTLTKQEINTMVNDIIPNRKPVPKSILQKAVDHANKRVRAGKSPFAQTGKPVETTEPKTKTEFSNTLKRLQLEDYDKAKAYYDKYLDKFY